jgi:hypothetical protein
MIIWPAALRDVFLSQQLWALTRNSAVRRLILQVLQTLVQPTNRFCAENAATLRSLNALELCLAIVDVSAGMGKGTCQA